jgi:hypothetical protein
MLKSYMPAWYYFEMFFGTVVTHMMPSSYDHTKMMPYERVYVDHQHEGKIVLDIRPKV